MTLQAGKSLHSHTMYAFVLMTVLAGAFVRFEEMQAPAMAYLALYVEHKDVFGMPVRFPQRKRTLFDITQVTGLTLLPRPLPPVRL